MVNIQLSAPSLHPWTATPEGYARGYAFAGKDLLRGEALIGYARQALSDSGPGALPERLNGHFALILKNGGETWLIADKLKSFPLFYYADGGGFTVCDRGEYVRGHIPDATLDTDVLPHFLAAGYLFDHRTLYLHCKTVEAGSAVCLAPEKVQRFSRKAQALLPKSAASPDEIMQGARQCLLRAGERMERFLHGRPALIPLSGGYDSRLVACLCKTIGLDRTECFTYGIKGSPEVETARRVARKLGFGWHHVEYDAAKWHAVVDSPDFTRYLLYGGNLNAVAHLQDFLAIKELKERQCISPESVVLPGHTGDFLGGGHFPCHIGSKALPQSIYEKYYDACVLRPRHKRQVLRDLAHYLEATYAPRDEAGRFAAFYEWAKRARQANFIVNGVRAYEFHGLDWYVPLWDDEYARFWESIPGQQRAGSALYNRFMRTCFFAPCGVDFPKPSAHPSPLARALGRWGSHDSHFLLKRFLQRRGLYRFPPNPSALDHVAEFIAALPFDRSDSAPFLRACRPESTGQKAICYLSLLRRP